MAKKFEYQKSKVEVAEVKLSLDKVLGSSNVAELIDDENLKLIGQSVIEGYELDLSSRSHREAGLKLAQKFALGEPEYQSKNEPWEGASNYVYPLISNAAVSFAARAYPAIVRDGEVVDFEICGNDDGVPLMGADGQPVMDMRSLQPQPTPDGGTQLVPTQPIWVKPPKAKEMRAKRAKEYMNWQFSKEIANWDEDTDTLLNAFAVTGNMYRKVYWDSEEGRVSSHLVFPVNLVFNYNVPSIDRAPRLTEEIDYYPYEVEEMIRSGLWLDGDYLSQGEEDMEEESERMEMADNSHDNTAPHVFLEQLTRLDLDGDGYGEPYIVTVHKGSGDVVRIMPDFRKEDVKTTDKGTIKRIDAETIYIHYSFIPSPDGSALAIGFGEWLLNSNKVINTLYNQLIDAGTLSNTSTGLIGRGLRMKAGSMKMQKGEFKIVDTRGGSIRENFVQIDHKEPSMVLFQLLGSIVESTEKLAGLQDVLQGEQLANQAAVTQLAAIEQGLTQFKSIHKRIQRAINKEIKLVAKLNSIYLENSDYQAVMDSPIPVRREDFDCKDYDIVPVANSYMVSDTQRMARLSYLDSLRGDPFINQEGLRKEIFDLGGMDKMEKLITTPPPAPQDPMIELQKAMMQVEGLKAQIKEKERIDKAVDAERKAEREGLLSQMKINESMHKAKVQEYESFIKGREQEFKLHQMAVDSNINLAQAQAQTQKTNAEIQKIDAQIQEIYANIRMKQEEKQDSKEESNT